MLYAERGRFGFSTSAAMAFFIGIEAPLPTITANLVTMIDYDWPVEVEGVLVEAQSVKCQEKPLPYRTVWSHAQNTLCI